MSNKRESFDKIAEKYFKNYQMIFLCTQNNIKSEHKDSGKF